MKAFVYRWHDKLYDKFYIGSHKGTVDDGYICSSEVMLAEYNQRPNDFEREIISVHESYNDALQHEVFLLQSLDVKHNVQYYNRHNGNGKVYPAIVGRVKSLKERKRLSIALTGKKRSEESKRKQSETNKGKTLSPEQKAKISAGVKKFYNDNPNAAEAKAKLRKWNVGKKLSEEHKQKIRESLKKDWHKKRGLDGRSNI